MSGTLAADTWMYGVLSADATMQSLVGDRIYIDEAEPEAAAPFVVIGFVDERETANAEAEIVMMQELWLVRAVAEGRDYGPCAPIIERVMQLLHKQQGSTAAGIVVGCKGENRVRYATVEDGIDYRQIGRYFRIYTQG